MNDINKTNEVNQNSFGTKMKIVEYRKYSDITVEFQDEYKYKKKCSYKEFKNGKVKNPYDKEIFGIGYTGVGIYKISENKKLTKCYICWNNMLKRCYDPYYLNKRPTYRDCMVCEEWYNFQNFAKWYYDNYYEIEGERMCLDKDILVKGNKVYSPKTCVFTPNRINILFTKRNQIENDYPMGVFPLREKIQVQCCGLNDKYLAIFEKHEVRKAWLMYKLNKELVIQSIADEYKDLIPKKLYDAMYRYEVEIND